MKQCKQCQAINSKTEPYCLTCGSAELEIVGDELPFERSAFVFGATPRIKSKNIKVNPFPKTEKDFNDIARAMQAIVSLAEGAEDK